MPNKHVEFVLKSAVSIGLLLGTGLLFYVIALVALRPPGLFE